MRMDHPEGLLSHETGAPSIPKRGVKRTRVQLACQRCKARKQKCDGNQPECSTCIRLDVECRYRAPPVHQKPREAATYIRALENRVAELETVLTKTGDVPNAAVDHWTQPLPQAPTQSRYQLQHSSQPNACTFDGSEEHEVYHLASVRDVSLNASGFIGGSSTITLARVLGSILDYKGKQQLSLHELNTLMASEEASTPVDSRTDFVRSPGESIDCANTIRGIQSSTADRLLSAYFKHVAVNFPLVHSTQIKSIHRRREALGDQYEETVLNLVYALGGQFLETVSIHSRLTISDLGEFLRSLLTYMKTGQLGNYQWKYHYEAALEKREAMVRLGDTRTIYYFLLIIQLCLRVPRDPGSWTFVGIAMRLCVELGLHRKKRTNPSPTLQSELEKRLFWACYYFDRDLSFALGRPPSISDHDIDIELPLDVDEECTDPKVFQQTEVLATPVSPSTTLSCFIHTVRLKRIESRIQYKIYRVDVLPNDILSETESFLKILASWKDAIPPSTHPRDDLIINHYPQLYETVINEHYLELSTAACIGICETYRRLHDSFPVAFSTLSLQTVFIAGLTLVFCTWHAPASSAIKNMSALSDCSILLYIMTDRWPNIRRYRDAFEAIKRTVLSLIAEDKHQPRRVISSSTNNGWSSLQGLNLDMIENINRDDLEQMISDMTGERMLFPPWNDTDMGLYDDLELNEAVTSMDS